MLYSEGKKNLFNSMTHYISKNPNFTRLTKAQFNLRDILLPVHADFQNSGMTPGELEALLQESVDEVRAERRAAAGPSASRLLRLPSFLRLRSTGCCVVSAFRL